MGNADNYWWLQVTWGSDLPPFQLMRNESSPTDCWAFLGVATTTDSANGSIDYSKVLMESTMSQS